MEALVFTMANINNNLNTMLFLHTIAENQNVSFNQSFLFILIVVILIVIILTINVSP